MATYHGGDGGNEDPRRPWWKITWGCKGSGAPRKGKGRGPCQNLNLEAEFEKKGRLSIDFDTSKLNTWQAIGPNSSMYKSLIGTLVRHIPQTYDSWEHVPTESKDFIIPTLNTRFKLDHFIQIPNPQDPIRRGFRLSVDRDCSDQYRLRKSQFKRAHFSKKGGLDAVPQLEQAVPPEGMSQEDWRALLGYYQREDRVKQSARNSKNRGKQVLAGTHGRKSYSQYVHQEKVEKNKDVDLVDLFEIKHKKKKDKQWEHLMAEEIHSQLKKKKEEAEQDPVPTPDPDIVMDVRGPRPGHCRGIGRVIRQMGSEAYDYTHLTQGQAPASFDLNTDPPRSSQASSLFEELFNYSSYAQAPIPPQPSQQFPTAPQYSGGSSHVNLDDDDDEDESDD